MKLINFIQYQVNLIINNYESKQRFRSLILDGESESIPQILEVLEMYKNHNKS